jgi:tetratricopeptide (TPR) repeat protein
MTVNIPLNKVLKAIVALAAIFLLGIVFKELLKVVTPQDANKNSSIELVSEASDDAFIKGNYKSAIEKLTRAIALDTANSVAYVVRGRLYAKIKDHDKALADLNKAILQGETDSEVYLYRAEIYFEMEDYAKSFNDYSASIDLRQTSEAFIGKGNIYLKMNNLDEAIACYTKAIELSKGFAEAYFARGNAYNRQAKYREAVADFERAMELNPENEKYKQNRDFALRLMN